MNAKDTEYFFNIVYNFSKVLPPDIRKLKINIQNENNVTVEEIVKITKDVFLNLDNNIKLENKIIADLIKIINAIKQNEKCKNIYLVGISRFSLVFKIGTKVLKIGFQKIIYKYPRCKIILNSIIRKQYILNNKAILFLEVQEYKENDLKKYYTEKELDEIVYHLWKILRINGIIWYDPKVNNIVLNNNNNNIEWNEKYYKKTDMIEKGIYDIKEYDDNQLNENRFSIVDTDLFLPIDIVDELKKIYKKNPNLEFFKNWKYMRLLECEERFKKEQIYE